MTQADRADTTVQSADARPWIEFSPASRFSFVSAGGPGVPEFFEERSLRGDGPPLHRHPWATWEIVVSGTVRVQIDGLDHVVTAGGTIYTPPSSAHTYVVESDEAHLIGVGMSEGRFYSLQSQAPPLFAAEGGPDMAAVSALAASCDVELLGPPLGLGAPQD
jgi:mannose-6-phosphate isomerase-like protein (cupin superfamily)